ncbi:AtpZ/AtpI family protein [Pannonibacter tanglangensis]|uniref:ATP F0F1 synthase subunit I n=1 Tax=Pannonibacter tanglangensis TaxID=2750084 RepID=A0ABW9ZLC7_9HYPH|nr:AtpZ/AtpI family protein [Pannonibacter sp. XCT-34]NBN64401.1 ATP F0F1 synthase subunit I [Pannonibacter sp. XCT-34]
MNQTSQQGGDDGAGGTPSEADLSARRDKLTRLLDERRRADEKVAAKQASGSTAGLAQAMKLSSEFMAGIAAGGMMGWLLDHWVGTSPFGLIVFLLLGFAAGVLNVLRATGQVAEQGQPYSREAAQKKVESRGADRDSGDK